MDWSPQQDAALVAVRNWIRDDSGQQVFRLFGYAGTGKTTMAKHLAEDVEGRVLFGAFTGKAAHVLRSKGCSNASTIHRLIYIPKDKSGERLAQLNLKLAQTDPEDTKEVARLNKLLDEERKQLKQPAFSLNIESEVLGSKLVIIDECSMVGNRMGEDLLSFGKKVLVLGDPAQLPPVRSGGFFTNGKPDIMLTEIHRQAENSPIIQIATAIRKGLGLSLGQYGQSIVTDKRQDPETVLAADQVLVGRNATRRASNARLRSLLGRRSWVPEAQDRLVCLRNDHEMGFLNGAIWNCANDAVDLDSDTIGLYVCPEDRLEEVIEVEAWTNYFRGKELDLPWWERKEAQEFDYGYALTVHKAQGSQWENVLVFDESAAFKADAKKWLYTAVTRAANKITVVRN